MTKKQKYRIEKKKYYPKNKFQKYFRYLSVNY